MGGVGESRRGFVFLLLCQKKFCERKKTIRAPLVVTAKKWYTIGQLKQQLNDTNMALSYKRLWKLLIDRDMTRTDLRVATGISTSTFAKMSRGECIESSIIDRICANLKCDVGDIMSFVDDAAEETEK